MKSLGKTKKVFLTLGAALVAAAFLVPNKEAPISILTPDIQWGQFSISPRTNIEVTRVHPDSIVFVSNAEPQARLTISKNGNFSNTPKNIVKSLCRNDRCTYVAYNNPDLDGAIARFQSDNDLQLVLIRSQKEHVWMEYKGPTAAFIFFEPLISEFNQQIELNNQVI
ncbi:hypothetical protein N8Z26_04270 [Burkholderiales bacterium]|nr:hypothetical protein [Burkholderiales bacterium]